MREIPKSEDFIEVHNGSEIFMRNNYTKAMAEWAKEAQRKIQELEDENELLRNDYIRKLEQRVEELEKYKS